MTEYVYNFYSSIAIFLPMAIVLLVFFFILKKKFKFDNSFFEALLPFVIAGATIRALADKRLLPYGGGFLEPGFYTHTPGLWLAGGFIVFFVLLAFPRLGIIKKIGWAIALALLAVFFATGFPVYNWFLVAWVFALSPVFAWLLLQKKFKNPFLCNDLNFAAFAANSVDGAASVVGFVFLNCFPKHAATAELLQISPLLFFAVKILEMLFFLFAIEIVSRKILKSTQAENYAKIFFALFWLATGIRTILSIGSGYCGFGGGSCGIY